MRASKLTKRITIQQLESNKNSFGETIKNWVDFKSMWAEVRPTTGRSFWEAQQINSEITHQVIIRYTEGIKPSMRIKYNNRYFDILYVMNFNEGNEALQLLAKELIK